MTIVIGWWALPFAFSIIAGALAAIPERAGYYGFDVVGIFKLFGAVILSLIAWLVWAVLA